MFDLDASKLMFVGIVALIVVGPKDLPRALRLVGRAVAQMRRLRSTVRSQVGDLMKEVDFEATKKEFDGISRSADIGIAINPRTAMRGHLPSAPEAGAHASASTMASAEAIYASPEMRDYLAPSCAAQAVADPSSVVELAKKIEADGENTEAADGHRKSTESTLAPSAVN